MHGYETTRIKNSRPYLKTVSVFIKTLESYVVSLEQRPLLYFHLEVPQVPLVCTLSVFKDHRRNIHTLNGGIFSSWVSSLVLFSFRLLSPVTRNCELTNTTISLHRLDLALQVSVPCSLFRI